MLPIDFTDFGWVVEEWFSLCLSPGYLRSRINTAEIPLPYICTQNKKLERSFTANGLCSDFFNFFAVKYENGWEMRKQALVHSSSLLC